MISNSHLVPGKVGCRAQLVAQPPFLLHNIATDCLKVQLHELWQEQFTGAAGQNNGRSMSRHVSEKVRRATAQIWCSIWPSKASTIDYAEYF